MSARLDLDLGTVSAENVKIHFGPHFVLEIERHGEKVDLVLVATHHGVRAEATRVGGELDKMIDVLRREFPNNTVD